LESKGERVAAAALIGVRAWGASQPLGLEGAYGDAAFSPVPFWIISQKDYEMKSRPGFIGLPLFACLLELACGIASAQDIYAPEPAKARKTLLQWSGSNEEGGPPGFDEPLASDRPDFVEASTTVGRGVRQLEMGYTFYRDRPTQFSSHSFPEFLFRYGVLADWFEFRAGLNFASMTQGSGPTSQTTTGAEDLYLGVKLGLTPQDGILPEMAIVPQMTVPWGAQGLTSGEVLPGINWLYGWDISDFLSLGASTQANLEVDSLSGSEYLEFAQAFTFGYTLTEKLGAYTEWFMITPAGAESAHTEHYVDAGLTYRVSNNLQLDVRAGKGVSGASVNSFVGTGAVIRW
jgi:hypothetical protein